MTTYLSIDGASAPDADRDGATPTPLFRIGYAHPGTPLYAQCAEHARRKYEQSYGATIDPRPDLFVTAWDANQQTSTPGRILGLAGLTSAATRVLLAESYLDVPVEQACTDLGGDRPDRRQIVQMGPVVSLYPGSALFLMSKLPGIVVELGYRFLLATVTERLHGVTKAAGWDFRTLANARQGDLGDATEWGTYFATRPRTGILRCGLDDSLAATG